MRYAFSFSRHGFVRVLQLHSALKKKRAHATLKRGRGEDRVRAAPAISCAMCIKRNAHEHTGSAEAVRPSLRNGFTAYFVLSPATGLVCHRHPREALASQELDASIGAPGPHDSAVRSLPAPPGTGAARPRAKARDDAAASTASHPNVSDD